MFLSALIGRFKLSQIGASVKNYELFDVLKMADLVSQDFCRFRRNGIVICCRIRYALITVERRCRSASRCSWPVHQ